MFTLTPAVVSLALCHLAAASPAVKRALTATIGITGPATINSRTASLPVSTVVTATGDPMRVLKLNTALDTDASGSSPFVITDQTGAKVPFKGQRYSVSLGDLPASQFVAVTQGNPVTQAHDLTTLYDFTGYAAGTFTFTVTPKNELVNIGTGLVKPALVTATVTPLTITATFTRRRRSVEERALNSTMSIQKRATNDCADTTKKGLITQTYNEAKSLATTAANYVTGRGATDPLFVQYFSTNTATDVAGAFNALATENSNLISLNCNDPGSFCTDGVLAYETGTGAANQKTVRFCPLFFTRAVSTTNLCNSGSGSNVALVANRNTRGGIGITALGHTQPLTEDYSYGCTLDQTLATRSAPQSLLNADNYQCFATQVYANTVCQ